MQAQPHPATPNLAPSLGVILRNLAALIARRFLHHPLHAALTIPLWQHLTQAALRLDRLRARLAAGSLPPPRPRASNHSGPRHRSPFPTKNAWLIRALGTEAAAYATQLEALLAERQPGGRSTDGPMALTVSPATAAETTPEKSRNSSQTI